MPLPDDVRGCISTSRRRRPRSSASPVTTSVTSSASSRSRAPEIAITFTGKHGVVAHATLGAHGLHVVFDGVDIELDLTRRGRSDCARLLPARGHDVLRRTCRPPATAGRPPRSRASACAPSRSRRGSDAIVDAVPTSAESPAIHALLIARHGKLVVDEYFDGYTAETPHDTRSAGKSWGTTLVGIAIDRGELALTTPVDRAPAADHARARGLDDHRPRLRRSRRRQPRQRRRDASATRRARLVSLHARAEVDPRTRRARRLLHRRDQPRRLSDRPRDPRVASRAVRPRARRAARHRATTTSI